MSSHGTSQSPLLACMAVFSQTIFFVFVYAERGGNIGLSRHGKQNSVVLCFHSVLHDWRWRWRQSPCAMCRGSNAVAACRVVEECTCHAHRAGHQTRARWMRRWMGPLASVGRRDRGRCRGLGSRLATGRRMKLATAKSRRGQKEESYRLTPHLT